MQQGGRIKGVHGLKLGNALFFILLKLQKKYAASPVNSAETLRTPQVYYY